MRKLIIIFTLLFRTTSLMANDALPERLMVPTNEGFQLPKVQYFDGKTQVELKVAKPTYILLNFWATWCPACVAEMSSLDELAKKEAKNNLKVIAVNVNEGGPSEVKPFLTKTKLKKITILYDSNNKSAKDFGIRGLPTTLLISPTGNVIAKLEGSTNWDSLTVRNQIEKYIDINQ